MAKIKIKNNKLHKKEKYLKECFKKKILLESGEEISRGCGLRGLYRTQVGWRCLYCGNYLYQGKIDLEAWWFHFKIGREYWRVSVSQDKMFINGIPISGLPDSLPGRLKSDLTELRPPKWFPYFVAYEGHQFKKYFERYWNV